jgi:hypothetical protein
MRRMLDNIRWGLLCCACIGLILLASFCAWLEDRPGYFEEVDE